MNSFLSKVQNHFIWKNFNAGKYDTMDDASFVKMRYKATVGHALNLEQPKLFSEKLQWLKVYYHDPLYTKLVDKYEAKKYVAEKIGEEHVIPTYGVWDSFDAIDFNNLPNSFILKVTHNSGGFVICKDKSGFDKESAREKLSEALKTNYYSWGREWPYKNVKPRIIAEEYIPSLGHPDSIEYKTTCFDGKVGFVTICQGVAHASLDERTNDSFDINKNHMPWYAFYKNAQKTPEIPEQWDELISICEKLSEGIPSVRVDTYIIDGKIYFGELTFYTWGGFLKFTPPEWDEKLGEFIKLPDHKIL